MSLERRLAASVVLLVSSAGLLAQLLPENTAGAAALVIALTALLIVGAMPLPRRVHAIVTTLTALGILAASTAFGRPESFALITAAPLSLLASGFGTWPALVALGLGFVTVSFAALLPAAGPDVLAPLSSSLAGETWIDRAGQALFLGWFVWQSVLVVAAVMLLRRRIASEQACKAMDTALSREKRALATVIELLSEPASRDVVPGLHDDRFTFSTRIDERFLLVGELEGPPLATMTVAWCLRFAAQAGMTHPASLRELVRERLDEIVSPDAVLWLGFYDKKTQRLTSDPKRRPPQRPSGRPWTADRATQGEGASSEAAGPTSTPEGPSLRANVFALASAAGAAWVLAPLVPWTAAVPLVGLVLVHGRLRRDLGSLQALAKASEATASSRIETLDDLHRDIGRLHGSLLPYEVTTPGCVARAHRLRADALDGTFADVFAGADDRLFVLAGEARTEGLAARFLGLAVQIEARLRIASGTTPWPELTTHLERSARRCARSWGQGVHLSLGMLVVGPGGRVEGLGNLHRFACRRADGSVETLQRTVLRPGDQVYVSPARSVQGPEDLAPDLVASEATSRIVACLTSGNFRPDAGSLPSLFALVFDGVHAPPHGTLVELSGRRPPTLALVSATATEDSAPLEPGSRRPESDPEDNERQSGEEEPDEGHADTLAPDQGLTTLLGLPRRDDPSKARLEGRRSG